MTTYRVLQCNTDNLRHGWDYLKSKVSNSDLILLQRFPKEKRPELCESMDGKVFMLESCPPHNLCLALGKTRGGPVFSGTESITLPSVQHVMAISDAWQGCTALKTVISDYNVITFLPCYQTDGEYPITNLERMGDIEFLLEQFKDKPTVIAGDFHVSTDDERTNKLLEKHGFKSYLDEHNTFAASGKTFNLDKLISNVDIGVENVIVYEKDVERGHFAITYDLSLPKIDK